jgi:hypothetical protein
VQRRRAYIEKAIREGGFFARNRAGAKLSTAVGIAAFVAAAFSVKRNREFEHFFAFIF